MGTRNGDARSVLAYIDQAWEAVEADDYPHYGSATNWKGASIERGMPHEPMSCAWCDGVLLGGVKGGNPAFPCCRRCWRHQARFALLNAEKVGGLAPYLARCREDGIDIGDGPALTAEIAGRPAVTFAASGCDSAHKYLKQIAPKGQRRPRKQSASARQSAPKGANERKAISPLERVREARDSAARAADELAAARRVLRQAVIDARADASLGTIAAELKISRQAVHQLVK